MTVGYLSHNFQKNDRIRKTQFGEFYMNKLNLATDGEMDKTCQKKKCNYPLTKKMPEHLKC